MKQTRVQYCSLERLWFSLSLEQLGRDLNATLFPVGSNEPEQLNLTCWHLVISGVLLYGNSLAIL